MLTLKIQITDVLGDDGNPVDSNGMIFFKIAEQSGFDKGFTARNGIQIISDREPRFFPSYPALFIRGFDKSKDNKTICVTREDFLKIQEAIQQVLEDNKRKYLKTITFLYSNGHRYKVNVFEETLTSIRGLNCDNGKDCCFAKCDVKDLEVLKNSF